MQQKLKDICKVYMIGERMDLDCKKKKLMDNFRDGFVERCRTSEFSGSVDPGVIFFCQRGSQSGYDVLSKS